ncbi:methyl-accepting chemotaxis protein [Marinomonas sp. M1K-6]|uniref:Methyl-accepting chemotaxis protein n=1 Tax=Marinomonas profundi TaxID=2726122 RepID=A0A847R4G1_9GAMM|nr:methyl-accepting chemotaxis protein [Marinomonas profundi]NLQ18872.1 methyl-accepting chemotaxis protein [Marinomonas profundi]UDV01799.1 methyl-accepting chemotaxis protein [Marinomonas profundi]
MRLHSIRVKTTLPIVVMGITFTIALISMGYIINQFSAALDAQADSYGKASAVILNADRDLYQAKLAEQRIVAGVGDLVNEEKDRLENAQQVEERLDLFRQHLSQEAHVYQTIGDLDSALTTWLNASNAFVAVRVGEPGFVAAEEKANSDFQALRDMLDKAGEAVNNHAVFSKNSMLEKAQTFERFAIIIVLIGLLISVWFSYKMPKVLANQVQYLGLRIREISEGDGDLTQRIEFSTKDELGDLANEFNGFIGRLRDIIASIHQQSDALGDMTGQLNEVATKTTGITTALANASTSIVSAGHEMDMSNQQMASVARDTADEAKKSNTLTQSGMTAVNKSHRAITELVSDIELALDRSGELQKSSDSIASVLEVIRNIAEQTNLLALNAAIEAARAGEQGRGFAVVADEVRTLATRTQDSTNEIETMIEKLKINVAESSKAIQNSRDNAESTVSYFEEVTKTFNDLQSSFAKVQEMAAQTAQATQEQSIVANDINRNMVSLKEQSDSVQSVSDLLQQQSQDITKLYKGLDQQVGSFKV